MELDRNAIERRDFSAARRGYDPEEVDRHLAELADAVAELKRSSQTRSAPASLAASAAEQVRGIVEAAERSAAEIQEKAEAEAQRITDEANRAARETREKADADAIERVRRAEEATESVLQRTGSVEGEIDRLLADVRSAAGNIVDRLRDGSSSLSGELSSMREEFASVREARLEPGGDGRPSAVEDDAGPVDAEPEVVAEGEDVQEDLSGDDTAVAEETVVDDEVAEEEPEAVEEEYEEEPEAEAEEEPVAEEEEEEAPAEAAGGGRSIRGAEGARLIALNMALNGTPRDETARYLEQNFELDDQDALLDEVYARVGG